MSPPGSGQPRRVVLVTGATRGIGASIADEFRQAGALVIGTGTRADEVDRLNSEAREGLEFVQADFSNKDSIAGFLERIEGLARLDVCVNNAGINIIKSIETLTVEDFDQVTTVDYRAPFLVAKAAASVMRRSRRGWIVNIASIWSVATKAGRVAYTSAKSGLVGLTRALAVELAPSGILVNSVSPGFVQTELTKRSLSEAEMTALVSQVPLGRFAEPREIARLVAFLGSDANTYITGQNIVADGGFTNV